MIDCCLLLSWLLVFVLFLIILSFALRFSDWNDEDDAVTISQYVQWAQWSTDLHPYLSINTKRIHFTNMYCVCVCVFVPFLYIQPVCKPIASAAIFVFCRAPFLHDIVWFFYWFYLFSIFRCVPVCANICSSSSTFIKYDRCAIGFELRLFFVCGLRLFFIFYFFFCF